jgi:phosphohistidine phosphatase
MDLYLIRHADALPLGEQGITEDAVRPLSDEGTAQSRALAAALTRRGIQLDALVSSPLLRAHQTAEGILNGLAQPRPGTWQCNALAPGGKRRKLGRFLRELKGNSIALVGHQPDLGRLAAWLIGSKKAQIDFAKAGIAHITCPEGPDKGKGILLSLMTPEWYLLQDGVIHDQS